MSSVIVSVVRMELPFLVWISTAVSSYAAEHKIALLFGLSLPLLRLVYLDYSGWHAMGSGGIPHNIFGYCLQNLLRLLALGDRRSIGCYDALKKSTALEVESFLNGDLPERPHARTSPWCVPHRQLESIPSETLKQVSVDSSSSHSYTNDSVSLLALDH